MRCVPHLLSGLRSLRAARRTHGPSSCSSSDSSRNTGRPCSGASRACMRAPLWNAVSMTTSGRGVVTHDGVTHREGRLRGGAIWPELRQHATLSGGAPGNGHRGRLVLPEVGADHGDGTPACRTTVCRGVDAVSQPPDHDGATLGQSPRNRLYLSQTPNGGFLVPTAATSLTSRGSILPWYSRNGGNCSAREGSRGIHIRGLPMRCGGCPGLPRASTLAGTDGHRA